MLTAEPRLMEPVYLVEIQVCSRPSKLCTSAVLNFHFSPDADSGFWTLESGTIVCLLFAVQFLYESFVDESF